MAKRGPQRVRTLITSYKLMVNARRRPIAPRFMQMAAYNMVNPRVIHQERSLCSPNENPDVAREFAVADQVAAVRGGNPKQIAQTKGMQDTTGGSMWAPF